MLKNATKYSVHRFAYFLTLFLKFNSGKLRLFLKFMVEIFWKLTPTNKFFRQVAIFRVIWEHRCLLRTDNGGFFCGNSGTKNVSYRINTRSVEAVICQWVEFFLVKYPSKSELRTCSQFSNWECYCWCLD